MISPQFTKNQGRIQLGNSSIFHDSRVQIGKLTCLVLIETTRKLNSAYIVDLCVISEGWWSKVARLLTRLLFSPTACIIRCQDGSWKASYLWKSHIISANFFLPSNLVSPSLIQREMNFSYTSQQKEQQII